MNGANQERHNCRHERLTVTFDLSAETIQVGCSECHGTWPEPDTPPDLMDKALAGAKDLIARRVYRDYKRDLYLNPRSRVQLAAHSELH